MSTVATFNTAPRTVRPSPIGTASASDRVELPGSAFPGLKAVKSLRSANSDEQLSVSVVLKGGQPLPDPTGPFQSMSAQDHQKYEATPAQIDSIRQFAKINGLSVASVDPETRTVKLQGSAANYQKAFGVKLQDYKTPQGGTFRAFDGPISVPRSLQGTIEGVFGLSNRPVARPQHTVLAGPKDFGQGYLPTQVGAMYNFPKGLDGTGQTIGILEFGGGYNQDDLNKYFAKLGRPGPKVTSVSVDGSTNAPNVDTDADGEVALDIEVAGSIAPGADIVVYFAPDTEQGFVDAINQASHDKQNNPKFLSVSWGSPEDSKNDPPPTGWSDSGRTAINNALKDAANMGVSLFVASGDDGSNDGANDGKNHVDFPSASPYAISVGGTRLDANDDGSRGSEVAWGSGSFGGASGGGVSNIFGTPDFQQGLNIPKSTLPGGGRGIPDVAGNADPATGYDVITDGSEQAIGGTSASAPLLAGLGALLGQGVGQPVGYLNPFFYKNPAAFNDITSGTNGAFKAGPGWDPVTGLGSPDGDKLLAALKAQAPQKA